MAGNEDTYLSYIMKAIREGDNFTEDDLQNLASRLKKVDSGEEEDDYGPEDDDGESVDSDGDGIYESVEYDEDFLPDVPPEDRTNEFRQLLSTGDTFRMYPIYQHFRQFGGVPLGPRSFMSDLLALYEGEPDLGSIAGFVGKHYGGPIEPDIQGDEDVEYSDEHPIHGFVNGLYDLLGVREPLEDDGGGVTYHDLNGNGTDETAVVTGNSEKELKKNAKKAVKRISKSENPNVSHHDLNGNGSKETAVVTGGSEDELHEGVNDAIEGFNDYGGGWYDDEDEEEDDTNSDERLKDKKDKKGARECVSDETMKNIVSALMDHRF